MIDLILYDLISSKWLIIIFLTTLFIVGCIIYFFINNFSLKKGRVKLYGILLELSSTDTLILSVTIIRTFLVIYYLIFSSSNVIVSLTMVGIISIIYIAINLDNVIYEIINTLALMAVIYFINILNSYLTEVTYSSYVQIIKVSLIAFAIMYTIYILFRSVEDIVTNNANINE